MNTRVQGVVGEYKKLRETVLVAEEQAVIAAMFHETWAPTVMDAELSARMGTSYARHSFQIIGWALRRELILALMRMWDRRRDSLSVKHIGEWLSDDCNFEVLLQERAVGLHSKPALIMDMLRQTLSEPRQRAAATISQYMRGGAKFDAFERLRMVRHKRLAHRDLDTPPDAVDPTDTQVVELFRDTLGLVTDLLHLVNGKAFDLEGAAGVYAHYAKYFWATARGEQTEGHPNYRAPVME